MNSAQTKDLVARLEAAAAATGEALSNAEHHHRLTLRSSLLTNEHGPSEETGRVVDACRSAHQTATARLIEARALHTETVEAERLAALDALRDFTRSQCSEIIKVAATADAKLSEAMVALNNARALETATLNEVRRILPREAPLGRQLSQTLAELSTCLRTAYNGATDLPTDATFASARADQATRALMRAVQA